MSPSISIIVPTRERAAYVPFSIRSCLQNTDPGLEILVLDNASTDGTRDVVATLTDPRIRYVRSESRLSMRDNFEKGLSLARGEIVGFIGDDDGLLPTTIAQVRELFQQPSIDAVAASRAHYFWPDLVSARRNTGLLPRGSGIEFRDSKAALRLLLDDSDYYKLPCLYHGFVRRSIVDAVAEHHERFFISSQVDIYSAIALSARGIKFAFSRSPLVINGGSSRSNGASHFGGGTQKEKSLWKKEDDLGFLPGFDACLTVGALIVESALRYVQANPAASLHEMLDEERIGRALNAELAMRMAAGRTASESLPMFEAAGVAPGSPVASTHAGRRTARLFKLGPSFLATRPINMDSCGVNNVFEASRHFDSLLTSGRVGIASQPLSQLAAALRLVRA